MPITEELLLPHWLFNPLLVNPINWFTTDCIQNKTGWKPGIWLNCILAFCLVTVSFSPLFVCFSRTQQYRIGEWPFLLYNKIISINLALWLFLCSTTLAAKTHRRGDSQSYPITTSSFTSLQNLLSLHIFKTYVDMCQFLNSI